MRGPIGGMAWHHLQYVLGLARLGHDVRFVEDSDDYPSCYDPSRHLVDSDPTYGLRFAADAFNLLGMEKLWAYYDAHTRRWLGPFAREAKQFCESADLLLNLSGVNPLREWTARIPVRAFVDTDPVFTQVRNLTKPGARERTAEHNAFFSFAENIEAGTARVPDDGFQWAATRQPIVLDLWPVTPAPRYSPYTTVMQWASYPAIEWKGVSYGTKAASFDAYSDLPHHTTASLEIALGGSDAPREKLREGGWSLQNPLKVALTPTDYRDYIQQSRGEFTVAKHGYVVSNSGWFSERSACYLASGRPVITQETGFSERIGKQSGVFAFRDKNEVLEALHEIEGDYHRHSSAARKVAEDYFDSSIVLSHLLSRCGQ